MIAHISPASSAFEESRNTLTYAGRAKNIKTRVRGPLLCAPPDSLFWAKAQAPWTDSRSCHPPASPEHTRWTETPLLWPRYLPGRPPLLRVPFSFLIYLFGHG